MPDNGFLPEESTPAEEVAPTAQTAVTTQPRSSGDPVVRWLVIVVLGLLVLYLAGVASALVFGILGSDTPRTSVERDLYALEVQVRDSSDPAVWGRYISSLTAAKQYARAQAELDKALPALDQSEGGELSIAQAQLYVAQERYEDALVAAEEAATIIKAYYDEQLAQPGMNYYKTYGINENYWVAVLAKAISYERMGQLPQAIEQYDEHLEANPTAADLLITRGLLKIEVGDVEGARTDLESASRFLPDDPRLNEGLSRIGVGE